ncbi:MAG TPA: glycosyltransferase family 2 protein [Planctomycetota bacterium]|nr:glycosyltransferase family 2 protein [Planctomycetota bacterium]
MESIPGRVSVIMATYNRSNVLKLAIETVRWQTLADWELIVVGDACTDDTAQVVAAFDDPRIRFINRASNFGEQSGPNNDGMRLARGEFIAMLNHDDLWWPRHLELGVQELRETGADLVFARIYQVGPHGQSNLQPPRPVKAYSPRLLVPASAWIFRKTLFERIGEWRPAETLYNVPSQDWIFRAHKSGAKLTARLMPTVIFIGSLIRDGSYKDLRQVEQQRFFGILKDRPDFEPPGMIAGRPESAGRYLGRRLGKILFKPRNWASLLRSIGFALARYFLFPIQWIALRFGVHPFAVSRFLRYGRKGGFVRWLRRRRGLTAQPLRS